MVLGRRVVMESSFRKNLPWVTIALIAANGILFLAAECTGSTLDTDVLIRWEALILPILPKAVLAALYGYVYAFGIRHLLNNMVMLYVWDPILRRF